MLGWVLLGTLAAIRLLRGSAPSVAPSPGHVTFSAASVGVPVTDSMDGQVIAASLPAHAGTARENAILALAESGQIPTPEVVGVTYTKGGHTVEIFPAKDALMLGTVNPVRLNARHSTAQRLADFFGMMLPTSLMSDQAWLAGTQIAPQTIAQELLPVMADTAQMIAHSERVDAAIAAHGSAAGTSGLVRPVGKDWVNTERLLTFDNATQTFRVTMAKEDPSSPAAANFGWQKHGAVSRSPGGQPVLQSVGLVHAAGHPPDFAGGHTDYSQVVTLYAQTCIIDGGQPELVEDVLRDPARAFLLSDEVVEGQAARVTRYPLVPLGVA